MANLLLSVTVIAIYCLSSMSLTMLNKVAMENFKYPNALLILQNAVTMFLILFLDTFKIVSGMKVDALTRSKCFQWLWCVVLFMAMLFTSLQSLAYVTVPTVVVFRNLTSLVVAALEFYFLGTRLPAGPLLAICVMVAGSVVYGGSDLHFDFVGYMWLFANVFSTGAFQVYVRYVTKTVQLSHWGSSYYNNALSVPLFLPVAIFNNESSAALALLSLSATQLFVVFMSTLSGFTLSVSAFKLNTLLSATSVMVLNNLNKIALIVLSEGLLEQTLSSSAALGIAIVFVGGFAYSLERFRMTQRAQERKAVDTKKD